jgi:hypothetical protein
MSSLKRISEITSRTTLYNERRSLPELLNLLYIQKLANSLVRKIWKKHTIIIL